MGNMPGRVDIGLCWTHDQLPPGEVAERLRRLGFDGIELWPLPLKAHGAQAWAEALSSNGLRCLQLCPYFDFMDGPESLAKSRTTLDRYLESARILDCHRLRTFTGPPWGEGVVNAPEATPEQWADTIEGLRQLCEAAGPEVELCLECHEGGLSEDSASALRLLEGVNRGNLTVNLQLPLVGEPWEVSLDRLGPHTTHAHVHNYLDVVGGPMTWLDDQVGVFDWAPVVHRITNELGRDLTLSVEHPDHGRGDDLWETARRDGKHLQALRYAQANR